MALCGSHELQKYLAAGQPEIKLGSLNAFAGMRRFRQLATCVLQSDFASLVEDPCNSREKAQAAQNIMLPCPAIVEIARRRRRNIAASRFPIAPFPSIRICFGFRASDFGFPPPSSCRINPAFRLAYGLLPPAAPLLPPLLLWRSAEERKQII